MRPAGLALLASLSWLAGCAPGAMPPHANGFDFADALHLAGAETAEVFATFDKSLCAAAARLVDGLPVREP